MPSIYDNARKIITNKIQNAANKSANALITYLIGCQRSGVLEQHKHKIAELDLTSVSDPRYPSINLNLDEAWKNKLSAFARQPDHQMDLNIADEAVTSVITSKAKEFDQKSQKHFLNNEGSDLGEDFKNFLQKFMQ